MKKMAYGTWISMYMPQVLPRWMRILRLTEGGYYEENKLRLKS